MRDGETNGSDAESNNNDSTDRVEGIGLGQIDSDAPLGDPMTVRLREDQLDRIETLVERYDLSKSEAVRLHFDLAGANPDRLQALEERLEDLERIDEAIAHINKAHPDQPLEIKEIRNKIRKLADKEEAPPWFKKYV